MNYKIIENGLIPVMENRDGEQLVDGRKLHEFLKIRKDFSDWIKSQLKATDSVEDVDFTRFPFKREGQNTWVNTIEYTLTLDTAKEICMVAGTAPNTNGETKKLSKQARRYFIDVEKRHKKFVKVLSKGNSKAGGLNGLLKTLNSVMKDEKLAPWKRAEIIKNVAENYGLILPDEFVNKPVFIQFALNLPIYE
ncbi:antA/AntB antirepressor family protein [Clostridium kluyveri]|uniref:antA/AntB antirepressor family protein n=1 Tax=Clostridium kluyveri TaxID=1534 RepID=UPI0022480BC0|nr:antA/AntB antirepressor family protein [Clostridium kluyveri]UZQ50599.1 antA/AntB antirepressor family protein [Clostridium kluyveri]